MIRGSVTADLEATVPVRVVGPGGRSLVGEAVVDTGFTGHLTLAPADAAHLGLDFREWNECLLADGSVVLLPVFRASVDWNGGETPVFIVGAEGGPLLGMSLLLGSHLGLDVVDGGDVTIEPLE